MMILTAKRFTAHMDAGLVIAALLTLFAIQALLQPGLPTSADMLVHLHRTMEFERAWAPGVVIPRWSPNLAFGYGFPLFIFAPPLPYLLAMGFHVLPGFNIEAAFKALIILIFLLYATGAYLFVRTLFNSPAAGLVAATAYTFAPFALREILLEGGNVPQFLAVGLFPWPLWAITHAVSTRSWGWTVLAGIFYAAIMLSHLFQAFIFTPIFGLYILLLLTFDKAQHKNKRRLSFDFWQPLLAPVIGLLLSAFFWLPAFTERYHTRAQADIYLEKSPFFVRYPYWPELIAWIYPLDARAANPYNPLTLGVVTLVLAGLALLAAGVITWKLITKKANSKLKTQSSKLKTQNLKLKLAIILFFAIVAAGAVFLTLPASQSVWETFAILQVAEFPWRMLGPANLGLAVLAGAAMLLIPQKARLLAAGPVIIIQLIAIAPFLYPVIPFTRHGQLTLADQINYERSSQLIGTTTLGEYLPQTVPNPPTTSPLVETFQNNTIPERLDRSSLPAEATAILLEQSAVTHSYQLESDAPFTLRLLQFNFPGWQAHLDGQPLPITTEPESGLILVDIPAGQHSLTLHFGETPVRVAGLSLSGLALVGVAAAAILRRRTQNAGQTTNDERRMTNDEAQSTPGNPLTNTRPEQSQRNQLPSTNNQLPITNYLTLATIIAIMLAALWLTPWLRPIFTVNSPRERVIPAQHATAIHFANGIQLVGYDLSSRRVAPGDYLQVVLYWQTGGAPHRVNLQPFVHLDRLDTLTTVAGSTNYTPGNVTTETVLPTFHWDNERYVRDEHDVIIPFDTPPLAYALRAGLIDPDQHNQLIPLADGSGDTARLGIINITPGDIRPARPAQATDVLFSQNNDAIRLTGYEITDLDSTQLEFNLVWQSDSQPGQDYTIFAQLLDASGQLATSFDRPPLDGAYPTSTWLPGQSISDTRYLPLDGVTPGNYTLIIGLYNPETGHRLTTPDKKDYVELSTISIP